MCFIIFEGPHINRKCLIYCTFKGLTILLDIEIINETEKLLVLNIQCLILQVHHDRLVLPQPGGRSW